MVDYEKAEKKSKTEIKFYGKLINKYSREGRATESTNERETGVTSANQKATLNTTCFKSDTDLVITIPLSMINFISRNTLYE
jgi:hypothetical protein